MSPAPPSLNPSQTVERIRQAIVGHRVEKFGGSTTPPRLPDVPSPARFGDIFEDRLLLTEARVEALQDHVHRIEGMREETLRLGMLHREEAKRLAMQICEITRKKADNSAIPAVERLERRLGTWLTDWQKSLRTRLDTRDRDVVEKVRGELAGLRAGVEKRLAELEARVPSDMEDRFNRIAAAARAFAESATSSQPATSPEP
jgi:hypothetical protein